MRSASVNTVATEQLAAAGIESSSGKETLIMAARPIWRGQIRLGLVSIPVEIYPATKSGARSSSTRSMSRRASASNMRRWCPGSARSTATRSSRAMKSRRAIMSSSTRRRSRSVKLESRKTLDLVQFVDIADIDPMYFDKPYYVVPADDLAEEAFVVLRDALRVEEGRDRPACHARAGICRRAEAVRPRYGAGNAALCRRGQPGAGPISARSATPSPIPTCSTWPRR